MHKNTIDSKELAARVNQSIESVRMGLRVLLRVFAGEQVEWKFSSSDVRQGTYIDIIRENLV